MDGNSVKQLRESLLKRREAIGGMLDRGLGNPIDGMGESQAEIIDIAQALETREREKTIADQERRELLAIERALAKLSNGNFGVCEDCDEEISSKRMMVVPEARLCARCQAIEERAQSRVARGFIASAR